MHSINLLVKHVPQLTPEQISENSANYKSLPVRTLILSSKSASV